MTWGKLPHLWWWSKEIFQKYLFFDTIGSLSTSLTTPNSLIHSIHRHSTIITIRKYTLNWGGYILKEVKKYFVDNRIWSWITILLITFQDSNDSSILSNLAYLNDMFLNQADLLQDTRSLLINSSIMQIGHENDELKQSVRIADNELKIIMLTDQVIWIYNMIFCE